MNEYLQKTFKILEKTECSNPCLSFTTLISLTLILLVYSLMFKSMGCSRSTFIFIVVFLAGLEHTMQFM